MPSLLARLTGRSHAERSNWYQDNFTFNGQQHPVFPVGSLDGSPAEHIGNEFKQRIGRVREANGVVAAAVWARALLVSQLRFQWRDEVSGRLFGDGELRVLERPGSDSRPRLLARVEEDASYAGNAYVRRRGNTLYRLRPDWVDLVLGSDESPEDVANGADAEVIGYRYWPGGHRHGGVPVGLTRGEVMHFAPEAHPLRVGVGASWVTGIVRDVIQDGQASDHISKFFENAATANMVVKAPDGTTLEQFEKWVEKFEGQHRGTANAWRNIYVSPGTDVNVVGSDLAQLDLRQLTGQFEARIAVRSRVPASVLGTREGMQGSALNAGNYAQVRRLWADGWYTPYAEMLCSSFEQIVPPRAPFVELTFDRDRVLFLQEDMKDAADIRQTDAQSIRALTESGWATDSIVEYIATGDPSKLRHTGVFSVQLQEPGSEETSDVDS